MSISTGWNEPLNVNPVSTDPFCKVFKWIHGSDHVNSVVINLANLTVVGTCLARGCNKCHDRQHHDAEDRYAIIDTESH